jgi:hypothetical protein
MKLCFSLHDEVRLPELIHRDLTGIILSIWITDKGTKYEVRSLYKNDTEEVLRDYKCWRSVDNMIAFITANVASQTLSSGGSWVMRDLGVRAEKVGK